MSDAINQRRNFLKLIGLGTAMTAISGYPATAAEAAGDFHPYSGPLPGNWDGQFDLVIVGGGGAGLCAAVEAAQRGVKLLVVEKMPFVGGISAMALGYLYGAETVLQKEQGIKNATREIWWRKLEDGTAWSEPLKRVRDNSPASPVYYGITKRQPQLLKDITWEYHTLIDFLLKYGAKFRPLNQNAPFMHVVADGYLPVVFRKMAETIRQSGGRIVTGTRADKLFLTRDGEIAGLRTVGAGQIRNYQANAVLMASGGFVNSERLIQRYMPFWAGKVPAAFLNAEGGLFLGQETGDGIAMGLEVNASLDDMDAGFKYKMAPARRGDAFVDGLSLSQSPIIFVTPEGRRVCDDSQNYTVVTLSLVRQGVKYGFFVFDQAAMSTPGAKNFKFQELADKGAVFKADTLREAALKAGIDPDGLQATVDRYNKDFEEKGVDSVFGKKGPLFQKISQPPFYVSDKHFPVRFKTEGGLETDARTRVLDHRTVQPIPGFYAAGATNGSCTAALGDSMQCGRMAARYIAEDLAERRI